MDLPSASADRHPLPPQVRECHWYRGPIVRGRPRVFLSFACRPDGGLRQASKAFTALGSTLVVAALASGCGGGSSQDAHEVARSYDFEVLKASFPSKQAVARPATLKLEVKNTGSRAVPNVAVTVDSFNYKSNYPGLADNRRPIWAIEQGPGANASPPVESQEVSQPGGGQTAYLNTWALGALPAGQTRTFVWKVIPVKPGTHTVSFAVGAGLAGKAKARLADGGPATGKLTVNIAGSPPLTHVDPKTGKVVTGAYKPGS